VATADGAQVVVQVGVEAVAEDILAAAADPEEEGQVAAGEEGSLKHSPIVDAIAAAESGTTGEIRVHLTRRWFEKDPYTRAWKLFHQFGMSRTTQRNGVLLYVNLRKHLFAIVGDEGVHHLVGQQYWESLAKALREDLLSTHSERAIATAVLTIGETLKKFFPVGLDNENPDELPNTVTED
jgi:uncharacterized membrane protein